MTQRRIDENGYMHVPSCPVSSYGIFVYGAGQLGLSGDPMRAVNVFRPESTVSDPAVLASFENMPLVNDHELLGKNGTAPEKYGVAGVMTSVRYAAPWMLADITVYSQTMQELIKGGKTELSLGYSCDFIDNPGVFDGVQYEFVQVFRKGNHIALVDAARVSGARILDSKRLTCDSADGPMVIQATIQDATTHAKLRVTALDRWLGAPTPSTLEAYLGN